MKTKTKFLGLVMAAVLLVTATIFGTMAFLTDTEDVSNTFTVGAVNIELDEADLLNPNDRTTEGNAYKLLPGQSYVKDPTVTVIAGSEEAYIRMLLTINKCAELDDFFSPDGANLLDFFGGYDNTKWEYIGNTKNETDNTRTYEFRYFETVDATEVADDIVLPALFTSITVPGTITEDELPIFDGLTMDIVANAIQAQAETYNTADGAWAAFDAQ
ncbi:MAG: SipW-dependent-type signal peptide-containing protein [Christensenellaceae bacterium]|jgi:predicted ribosomally synthesized peptide with SipW-like signal peptide